MQTLADMAEKQTTEGAHRVLVAAQSVVDDYSLAGWLEHEEFEVMTAVDSQEAVQIAGSSWQREVVLLDITLFQVDGLSVFKRVRGANRRALVFVLSASSREDEVRSLDAGADDYVATPFASEVLMARVGHTFVAAGRPESAESWSLETSGWMRGIMRPG